MIIIMQMRDNHPYTTIKPDVIRAWMAKSARINTRGDITTFDEHGNPKDTIIPGVDIPFSDFIEIISDPG